MRQSWRVALAVAATGVALGWTARADETRPAAGERERPPCSQECAADTQRCLDACARGDERCANLCRIKAERCDEECEE